MATVFLKLPIAPFIIALPALGLVIAPAFAQLETLEAFREAYPEADPSVGEVMQEDEVEAAFEISDIIIEALQRRFGQRKIRRDAHPKAHGCVRARFLVEQSINPALAKGVFRPGTAYDAIIRFSNGNEDPTLEDAKGDGRGMAMKLLGVESSGESHADGVPVNQDFIMINHPTFIVNDASDYLTLVRYVNSPSSLIQSLKPVLVPWAIGLKGTMIAAESTSSKIAHPLETRYWSMVPYKLGEGADAHAIKFSARPCMPGTSSIPDDPAHDFLRVAMRETLADGPACMEFLVQPRTKDSMSVEDSQEEWTEAEAPFVRVGKIEIPSQTFDTIEKDDVCENMSYNPWRGLAAHKPLGAINRMRKVIYERLSAFRRTANGASVEEPN